ncbi:MAG TPA: dihydroxy-acid dehydratase [Coriobacteriia bacterium]
MARERRGHGPVSRAMTGGLDILRSSSGLYRRYLERRYGKPRSSSIVAGGDVSMGVVRGAILQGLGIPAREMRTKPLIAVANSWCELNPGHVHLGELARSVKNGILSAGGIPFEFNVPAPCDGLGNGNEGMRFLLPQRDVIADMIELYVRSQWLDGLVMLSSCDKINPGMMMAAARLDLPAVFVPGGPNMMNIRFTRKGEGIDHREFRGLRDKVQTTTAATCGACELLTTANTMQCLIEAMGMALPGAAASPAFSSVKKVQAWESGERVVELVKEGLKPSEVVTADAIENAVMVALALGGSTNCVLHLVAIARELGIELDINVFNRYNRVVPTICSIAPSGPHGVTDLYAAGGVPAVMKRLAADLHGDCLSVSGDTIGKIAKRARVLDESVIRDKKKPYRDEGAIAVLSGNLAPEGCVVKSSAVPDSLLHFEGPALVFDGEVEALLAISRGQVRPGTALIVRYEGPRGGPGMPELLSITTTIELLALKRVVLITDARFSGASAGLAVGHVSPEAYAGGPIALVRDGDTVAIDVAARSITLRVEDAELERRKVGWRPRERQLAAGYLRRYKAQVGSASKGAVLGSGSSEREAG